VLGILIVLAVLGFMKRFTRSRMAFTCIGIAFGFSLVVILTADQSLGPGEKLAWMAINGIITSAVSYALARLIYRRRLIWAEPKVQKEIGEEPVSEDNN
jgi:hypothetical protein